MVGQLKVVFLAAWNLAAIFNFNLAELLDVFITGMKIISILKGRFKQELFTKVVLTKH